MATEQQIDRIKYLRGNGLSQKDIAEDVGLSPQMVSVILKDIASKFNETKPVRVIHAVGFEPKDTVIEFTTRDFENFRESETLYGAEQSVFEVRPGIVHKTTFPDVLSVDCYAEVADLLPLADLPNQLFDRENNYLWSPYPSPLATGTILSVAQISPTVYLIAHSNGTIYKYQ